MRPVGLWVHPEPLGSFRCALGNWGAHWGSSGSSGDAGLIGVHPGDRRVRPGSLDFLGYVLGVVGYVRGRWVHWGAPWKSSGTSCVGSLIRVHPGVHRVRPGSFGCALGVIGSSGVPGLIVGVCPIDCRVSLGSLGYAQVVVGFTAVAGFIYVRPDGGRGHPGSLCSLGCALGCVQSALGHLGAPLGSSVSFAVARFIGVRPWGC